jgi:hypothetical protein
MVNLSPRQLVIVGAVVCFFAAWQAPIATVPIVGSITYYANGHGDGRIVMSVCALVGVIAILGWVWVGAFGAIIVGGMLVYFQSNISSIIAQGHAKLDNSLFGGLASMVLDQVRLEWGFWLMAAAALVMFVGAIQSFRTPPVTASGYAIEPVDET